MFKFDNPNVDSDVRLRREFQLSRKRQNPATVTVTAQGQFPRISSHPSGFSIVHSRFTSNRSLNLDHTDMSSVLQQSRQSALQHGFVTDIESDVAPKGLNEDTIRLISAQEERARVAARVSPEGVSPLADDDRAEAGRTSSTRRSISRTISYYSAPKPKPKLRQHGRGRSGAAAHVREARRADARAADAGRRRGRRDFRQRFGRDHLQGEAGRGRHHLLLDLGGGAAIIPS